MSDSASGILDYVDFLQALGKESQEQFLIGGQAVNFWAEHFDRSDRPSLLRSFRPFTSKDCDVWLSGKLWEHLKSSHDERLVSGSSPADGQLGILALSKCPARVIDFLSAVYGIRVNELNHLRERAPVFSGIKVIDPIYLFLSKCHCLIGLPQSERQDERHVRMLSLILPAYFMTLVGETKAGRLEERNVIKELKLLLKISSTSVCRRALERIEVSPQSLIPMSEMAGCGLALLEQFIASQFPQG